MRDPSDWQLELGPQDRTQLGKTAAASAGTPPGSKQPRFRVQLHVGEEMPYVPLSATRATQPA